MNEQPKDGIPLQSEENLKFKIISVTLERWIISNDAASSWALGTSGNFQYHFHSTLPSSEFGFSNLSSLLENSRCYYCDSPLYTLYCYIIIKLKKAGLLDENFKEVCCNCRIFLNNELIDYAANNG